MVFFWLLLMVAVLVFIGAYLGRSTKRKKKRSVVRRTVP